MNEWVNGVGGAVDHETGRPSGPRASPRVVHDGVEPVSDGEDGTVIKLRPDGGLNEIVCFQVHGRCGLVQHQDLRLPQQGPGQAHKLALPDARPGEKDQETTVSWRLSGLCSIMRLPCELLSEGREACLSRAQMRRGAFCLECQSLAIKWGAQFPPEDKWRPG